MQIVHIRADGTVTNSIAGVVITVPEFYTVANAILSKKEKQK